VLVDEYGEGSRGEDHSTLYGHFLRATRSSLAGGDDVRVPGPAYRFIKEHRRIVIKEPFLVGLGAVGPGHEWAIPRMFSSVIPGLRRAGFSEEEIHYFTLHVDQDVDHGSWLEEALSRFGETAFAQAQIRRGAMLSLEARGHFWTGVQSAVVRYRQPRAARPDGPKPRSLPHEILLTAWDGWRAGQLLEKRVVELYERSRPTLAELMDQVRA
jgi:hypothetical protein